MLYGRDADIAAITALLDRARDGRSGVLVLRGDPGIGKTALLEHAAAAAEGMNVLRGLGVEFEAELPYAGLHMLLRDALGGLGGLPDPQRRAVEAAFGLGEGPAPEPMFVGLAVLSLLSSYAEQAPLLVAVDDAQWWDAASTNALLFAVRRMHAEGVALLLATRDGEAVPGFEDRHLRPLSAPDAERLLDARHGGLAPAVRHRVLTEADGNPLALNELPAGAQAAPAGALPLTDRLRLAFHGTAARLPAPTRRLLLLAALDHTGATDVLARAADHFDTGLDALPAAEHAGLVRVDGQTLAFRHPLVRNAIHQGAPHTDRLAAHRALAAALDGAEHADRRAWHLAQATTGTDPEVAALLEDTADRALRRGGYTAARAAYEEAARLSPEPADRERRLVHATRSAVEAGERDRAEKLLRDLSATAQWGLVYERMLLAFWRGDHVTAHRLAMDNADHAPDPARLLIQAFHAAWHVGEAALADTAARLSTVELADGDPLVPVVSFIIDAVQSPSAPTLSEGIDEEHVALGDRLMAVGLGIALGQDAATYAMTGRAVDELRALGAFGRLPTALFLMAEVEVFEGRYAVARETALEGLRIAEETGQPQCVSVFNAILAYLAALHGDEGDCRLLAAEAMADEAGGVHAPGASWAHAALARNDLAAGRVAEAAGHLDTLLAGPTAHHAATLRAVPDLVEAATRLGEPDRAAPALAAFEGWTARVDQPWAHALVARCRALLEPDADEWFRTALAHHRTGRQDGETARTALLYGEWLRRAKRKADARDQLRTALDAFDRLGMRPWAARARTELAATGTGAAAASTAAVPGPLEGLTPQESRIVRLAAEGLSNKDIAARLFLSPRTVGYHLYKAYPKLGVLSRGELAGRVA